MSLEFFLKNFNIIYMFLLKNKLMLDFRNELSTSHFDLP
jgi:hypothetical protein